MQFTGLNDTEQKEVIEILGRNKIAFSQPAADTFEIDENALRELSGADILLLRERKIDVPFEAGKAYIPKGKPVLVKVALRSEKIMAVFGLVFFLYMGYSFLNNLLNGKNPGSCDMGPAHHYIKR